MNMFDEHYYTAKFTVISLETPGINAVSEKTIKFRACEKTKDFIASRRIKQYKAANKRPMSIISTKPRIKMIAGCVL